MTSYYAPWLLCLLSLCCAQKAAHFPHPYHPLQTQAQFLSSPLLQQPSLQIPLWQQPRFLAAGGAAALFLITAFRYQWHRKLWKFWHQKTPARTSPSTADTVTNRSVSTTVSSATTSTAASPSSTTPPQSDPLTAFVASTKPAVPSLPPPAPLTSAPPASPFTLHQIRKRQYNDDTGLEALMYICRSLEIIKYLPSLYSQYLQNQRHNLQYIEGMGLITNRSNFLWLGAVYANFLQVLTKQDSTSLLGFIEAEPATSELYSPYTDRFKPMCIYNKLMQHFIQFSRLYPLLTKPKPIAEISMHALHPNNQSFDNIHPMLTFNYMPHNQDTFIKAVEQHVAKATECMEIIAVSFLHPESLSNLGAIPISFATGESENKAEAAYDLSAFIVQNNSPSSMLQDNHSKYNVAVASNKQWLFWTKDSKEPVQLTSNTPFTELQRNLKEELPEATVEGLFYKRHQDD